MQGLIRSRLTWRRYVITWLAYLLTGLLALATAAPGSPISQLYLAAGVGLGLVLGWGPRMLIALAIGGFSVVVAGHAIMHSPFSAATVLSQAVISGLGVAVQAWVGLRLVRPKHGATVDLELDRARPILRFLLLTGPVACLINPLISVPAMVALGILPQQEIMGSMLRWWAADTMGVLVGTPIVLTLVGQPRELWRGRRRIVGIPLTLATILLGIAIHEVQHWDTEREHFVFERDASATAKQVELRLNGYLDTLAALQGVFNASSDVTRAEFRVASAHWLQQYEGIQALGWAERIARSKLPSFEAQQRSAGLPQYRVFDRGDKPEDRTPPSGDELIALSFIEPSAHNETALGLNLLSVPKTKEAYNAARTTGKSTVSRSFVLTQSTNQEQGVVVYQTVFTNTHQVRGTLFATLKMDKTFEALMRGLPSYMGACMTEAPPDSAILGGPSNCRLAYESTVESRRKIIPLPFAGTTWQLMIWAQQPVPLVGRGMTSWVLTIAGVGLAAALGAMLLVMSGHTRRVELAMTEAERQRLAAEEANRSKSEFLSRMSHELRTPLNAVLGFAQVMEMDGNLSTTQQQRLQQIQQAGWHLLDMIDDVLDISRIETGTLRLQSEPVALRSVIDQACDAISGQAENVGITLQRPEHLPASWGVLADPVRLRQILQTLLENGVVYNHRKGKVTISVTRQVATDGRLSMAVAVRDTGMGMNEEQLNQLFQPFNRLGREKEIPDGAGVSLAISRHLATLMGGQLEVSSKVDQGSVFTLTLPGSELPLSEIDATATSVALVQANDSGQRHILYVEDNLANSEVVREALSARSWIKLSVAPTIERGLSILHNRLAAPLPDLILLDVHLPDASGQELLRLIKANPTTAHIPVIMISADAMPEQIAQALEAGAVRYMTKPVQLSVLLQQVDDLIGAQPT